MRPLAAALIAVLLSTALVVPATSAAEAVFRLITLDPGHFHAGLVQKMMYPQVSPGVWVYSPGGADLQEHLKRIDGFNTRAENPTRWEEKVYTGPDFLKRMVKEKPGNVVVISGNNARKTEYINDSIQAGLNVLADKPMAITPADFKLLRKAFDRAAKNKVLLYDIMTERFEIASLLQRELARMPEVFGTLEKGSPDHPAVVMENVHYFLKEVAGKPLTRPAWFFDVTQQGEGIPDVGTHLVDLIQWQCFPDQAIDWKKDIKVLRANRSPTTLTPEQFQRVTGLDRFPAYLKNDVGPSGHLNVFANGDVLYTLRGVHAKVTASWKFAAAPGAKDTHYALVRGSRAHLEIKQGADQNYVPTLFVLNPTGIAPEEFERPLRAAVLKLSASWPGLVDVQAKGNAWQILIPDKYHVGHEAHFAQVTEKYLRFLAEGKMPAWEVPNMIAKYYTTTEAYRLSHAR